MPTRAVKTTKALPVINPHAAGIDVGATEVYAAVPQDCDTQPVRCFATFTHDLHALADWFHACGIHTVAMPKTSRAARAPSWTASGCSTCTPWGYCAPPFARRKPWVPCAPGCATLTRSSPTRPPLSSLCKKR